MGLALRSGTGHFSGARVDNGGPATQSADRRPSKSPQYDRRSQLNKVGDAPEGLEDLKAAVDSLRNNVWAILSASRTSNYHVNVERFRLRRAIEITKGSSERSIMAT